VVVRRMFLLSFRFQDAAQCLNYDSKMNGARRRTFR
jgi:hypothetical protein